MPIKRPPFKFLLLALLILAGLIVILVSALPRKVVSAQDLDFSLQQQRLLIYQRNQWIWPTPADSAVTDVRLADFDRDQQAELLVSLWKAGYYGPDLPFWQTENINDYGQHLFVYEIKPTIKIKWGSSTIDYAIESMAWLNNQLFINNQAWIWEEFGFRKL